MVAPLRRMTRQRKVVLEELARLGTHPTADHVYRAVRRRLPRVSKGTVYRNLDILTEGGSALTLPGLQGQRHYDHNTHDHYHVQCQACGAMADVDIPPVEFSGLGPRTASGFTVTGHRIDFIGLCPDCRRRKRGKGK